MNIKRQIRQGLPLVGYPPYGQIHAHSTGNRNATAQNEADYMNQKPNIETGFFTHVVGNGQVIQVAEVNRGAWDVGGGWNQWGYAAVEFIESHKTKAEFERDYCIYVTLLRELADQAGIPKKLDSGEIGINTHEYCTYHQPNNGSDHVDPYPYLAKWGISRAQFKKDVENGVNDVKPDTTKDHRTFGNGTWCKFKPSATNWYGGEKITADEKKKFFRVTGKEVVNVYGSAYAYSTSYGKKVLVQDMVYVLCPGWDTLGQ